MTAQREVDPDQSLWKLLAYQVRERRQAKGWTQAKLAAEAHSSESHVGSIETGFRRPTEDVVRALDTALGANGSLLHLYRAARRLSEGKPAWLDSYTQAEKLASRIRTFEPQAIPGLLQTEAYARAMIRQICTRLDDIEDDLADRLERQEILQERTLRSYTAIIDEAALRRLSHMPREVAREQLEHLLYLIEQPTIVLLVLPFECGLHACMNGPMILLTIPGRGEIAWVEDMNDGHLITDEDSVLEMERRYDLVRAEALSARQSTQFLRDLLESL